MRTRGVVLTHHEWVSSQLRPFEARGSIADFLDQRVFHSVHEEPQQNLSYAVFMLFLSHLPQSHWQALCQRMNRPDAEDEEVSQEGLARLSWRVVRAVVQMTHQLLVPAAEALLEAEESARCLVAKQRARRRAMGGRLGEEEEEQHYLLWTGHMRRRYKYLSRELGGRRGERCHQEQQRERSGFGSTEESLSQSLWASTPFSSEMVHRLYLGLVVLTCQPPDPEDPDRQERWSQISSAALKCLGYVGDALADEMTVVEPEALGVEDMVGPLIQKVLAVVVRSWEGCHRKGEGRASLRVLKGLASEVSRLAAADQVEEAAVPHHTLENTDCRGPVQASLRHQEESDGEDEDKGDEVESDGEDQDESDEEESDGEDQDESDEEERDGDDEDEGDEEESDGEDEDEGDEEESNGEDEDEGDEEVCEEESDGEDEDEGDEEDYLDEDMDSEDVESRGQDECCDREQAEKTRPEMGHLGTRVPLSKHITLPFPPPILPRHRPSSRAVESTVPRRTIPNTPLGLEEEQVFVDHDPRPDASISPREVMSDLSSSKFRQGCLQVLKDLLCITLASSFPDSLALDHGGAGQPPLPGDPNLRYQETPASATRRPQPPLPGDPSLRYQETSASATWRPQPPLPGDPSLRYQETSASATWRPQPPLPGDPSLRYLETSASATRRPQPPLPGDPSLRVSSLDSVAAEILGSLAAGVANMCRTNVTGCALIPRLRMSEMDLASAGKEVHSAVREKLTDFLSGRREASERKRQAKQETAETFLVDLLSDLRASDLEEGGPAHALVGQLLNNMGYPAAKHGPPPGRGGHDHPAVIPEDQARALYYQCSSLYFSCHDLETVDLPPRKETAQEARADKTGRIRTMEDVVSAVLADVEPDEALLAGAPAAEVSLARLEGSIGRGQLDRRIPTLIEELSALLYEQTTPRRPWDSAILDPSEQICSFAMEAVNQLIPGAFPLSPPPSQGVDRHRSGSSYIQQNLHQMPPGGAGGAGGGGGGAGGAGGPVEPEDHGEVVDLYVNLIVGQVMENLKLSAAVSRNVLQVERLDLRGLLHPRRLTLRGRVLRSFRRISRRMRGKRSKVRTWA
ncbi:unnamed protein product [Lota lota]